MAISRNTTSGLTSFSKYNSLKAGVTQSPGPGIFLISGSSTVAYTSTDGFTWTTRTKPNQWGQEALNYFRNTFYALPAVKTSDGVTWTTLQDDFGSIYGAGFSLSNKFGYVYYDNNQKLAVTFTNSSQVDSFMLFCEAGYISIRPFAGSTFQTSTPMGVLGDNLVVATGNTPQNASRMTYFNPKTLTKVTTSVNNFGYIDDGGQRRMASNGTQVLVGSGSGIWRFTSTSDLGTNVRAGAVQAIHFENGLWLAATSSSGGIATSTDGVTWTNRTSNLTSGSVYGLAYGAGVWVIFTTGGQIASSPDGITWTQRATGLNTDIKEIAYA
jgi:hypothetical protein